MNKLLTKTLSVTMATGLLVAGPLTPNLNASEVSAIETNSSEVSSEVTRTIENATQSIEVDTNQAPMTYGQAFSMGINFTDPRGHTFNKDELIGYQASGDAMVTVDILTYNEIADDVININWGYEGTYPVRLQFDNSRFNDDGTTPYSYVDFNVRIVQAVEPVEPEPEEPEVEKPTEKPDEVKPEVEKPVEKPEVEKPAVEEPEKQPEESTDNGSVDSNSNSNNSVDGSGVDSNSNTNSVDNTTDNNVDTVIDNTTDNVDNSVDNESNSETDKGSEVESESGKESGSIENATQSLEVTTSQKKMTYGEVFDEMNIDFTDPRGHTFNKDELIGYQASGDLMVTLNVLTYDEIADDIVNINWGHSGTYTVRLQFDNSRFDEDGSTPYSYVDFNIKIVEDTEPVKESNPLVKVVVSITDTIINGINSFIDMLFN